MKNAEEWVRWYHARREDAGAQAIDLVASRGWLYEPVCGAKLLHGRTCTSTTRHGTKQGFYVCGSCGCLWPFQEVYSLKGEVETAARPDHFEKSISQLVDVGRTYQHLVDDPKWKWKARVFVASALGWTDSELLVEGPVAFEGAGTNIRWTQWGVRTARRDGRNEWVRRLRAIGIDTQ